MLSTSSRTSLIVLVKISNVVSKSRFQRKKHVLKLLTAKTGSADKQLYQDKK
jgi:cytochrome b